MHTLMGSWGFSRPAVIVMENPLPERLQIEEKGLKFNSLADCCILWGLWIIKG
jgi:hypothetical protein